MALTLNNLKVRIPRNSGPQVNVSAARGGVYLTNVQRGNCAIRLQAGDVEAGEKLIATSLGQIHTAVMRNSEKGVPDEDLVQEACLAVLEAGYKYDPGAASSFSIKASKYISDRIEGAVTAFSEAMGPLQFVPDVEALFPTPAAGLHYDPKDIITIGSLKLPRCLARFIIDEMLARLTDKQAQTLRLRFGLYNGETRTLDEVGSVLHCTRERVRQIEARALRKLVARWRVMSHNPKADHYLPVVTPNDKYRISYFWRWALTYKERRIMNLRTGFNIQNIRFTIEGTCKELKVNEEDITEIEKKAMDTLDDPVLKAKLNGLLYSVPTYNLGNMLHNMSHWRFIFS